MCAALIAANDEEESLLGESLLGKPAPEVLAEIDRRHRVDELTEARKQPMAALYLALIDVMAIDAFAVEEMFVNIDKVFDYARGAGINVNDYLVATAREVVE